MEVNMKKTIALVLSLIMVMAVFASCGGNKPTEDETKSYTVKVTIRNEGTVMYGPDEEITILQEEGATQPTVYDAVYQLLKTYGEDAKFETGTLGGYNIFTSIDGVKEDSEANKFWQFLVDGEEVDARYGAFALSEGMKIDFYYGLSADDTGVVTTAAPADTAK